MTAKRVNERHTKICFPTLGGQVIRLVFTSDLAVSYPRWIRGDEYDPGIRGAFQDQNNGSGVLILPWSAKSSTIAHEALHAVFALFEYVGVKMEQEIAAQYLGHIMREIITFRESCRR